MGNEQEVSAYTVSKQNGLQYSHSFPQSCLPNCPCFVLTPAYGTWQYPLLTSVLYQIVSFSLHIRFSEKQHVNSALILRLPIRHLYFQSGIIWITKCAHRSHLTCYHDFIWMENSPLRHFRKILVWVYASVTPGLEGRHRRVPGFSSLAESVRDPALKMRRGREAGRKQRRVRCLSLRSGL